MCPALTVCAGMAGKRQQINETQNETSYSRLE